MDRRFQEVNHESQRTRFQHYLMSPYKNSRSIVSLQQIGNTQEVKLKQALVYTPKPKYQFYPRGNIKDRRDLGRGWIFWTPLPCLNVSLSSVCASFRVGKGLFDLPVQV